MILAYFDDSKELRKLLSLFPYNAFVILIFLQVATIAWFEADSVCGSHSVAIPLVLVLPYLCRFFQCLRQYKDTKEKTCLLNGIYSPITTISFVDDIPV
jgi:hypothetical protein